MKKCIKCKIKKELSEFYIHRRKCKKCVRGRRIERWWSISPNKEAKQDYYRRLLNKKLKALKIKKLITHKKCYACKHYFLRNNFTKDRCTYDGLCGRCKKCNRSIITKSINKRLKNDDLFRLCNRLRSRVYNTLKVKGYKKNKRTEKILGASFKVVKSYIESQFKEGMNWNNNTRKGWHIDHIIPISSAKTENELIKLFHYTNLQPLWAKENISKSNKI